MQELKKIHPTSTENDTAATRLIICLQGVYHHFTGRWQWEMATDTVFCSDVMMCWPTEVEGTRAIFYPDDVPDVKAALQFTSPHLLSFRIITTYGEVKTLYGENVLPAEGTSLQSHPVQQWVSEAEQLAEQAKEAARNFLQLNTFDYAERLTKSGVWYTNTSTGETWFSDEMYRLLGLPPQSLNPHSNSLYAFLHAEDRKETIDALEESYAKQFPLHLEFRVVQAGGTERWMQQSTTFWFNKSGQIMMSGLLQDVTMQKEAEPLCDGLEATASFQKQLLHFAEGTANIGYWHINVVTKKVVYSDNFLRLFGLRPQSATTTASTLTNLVHPDDRELYEQVQVKIRREHAVPDFDFRIIRPDGKTRYIRQRGKVIVTGAEVLLAGTIQDVTVQRSLELKFAEAQRSAKVKAFVTEQIESAAGVGSWLMNVRTEDIQWSDNFHTLVGIKAATDKTTQALLLRAIHPDDQKRFSDELALAVQEGKPSEFPFRLIRRGEVRHLQASFRLVTVEDERLFVGVLQDVTPAQQTLQTLTERLRLIEALADSIPDQVLVTDTNNTVILWNRRCEEMHHRKREKVIGENFFDVLPSLKQEIIISRFDRALAGEEIQLRDEPGRYTLRGFYNMSHIPLSGEDGKINGILHILHDVTAEHDLHQQLTSRLQFIERLLEVSADSIVALDCNMNYLYWNKRAEKNFGLTGQAVIGKNILEVFPEVPQLLYQDFRRALRGEAVHLSATDEQPQENYLIPVRDQRDEVTSVLWVQHDRSRDFTIQRQSQKALDILSALNENYLELDLQYRVRFANTQTLQYFQRTEAEVVGHVLWDVFPVLIDTPLHLAVMHAMEERIVIRREFASPMHGISLLVSIAPTVDGLAVAFSDIGFIKEAEQRVAEEHRRLKEAQAIGKVGSFEWTVGDEFSHWSDELFSIHGLQPGEIETKLAAVRDFIHPADQKAVQALMDQSVQVPGQYAKEHRIIRKDAEVRWVAHQWECIANESGAVVRVRGLVQDITERKQAEAEAGLKQELLQATMNSSPDMIQVFEAVRNSEGEIVDFRYVLLNQEAEKWMPGVLGKSLLQEQPGVAEEGIFAAFKQVVETGVPQQYEKHYVHEQFNGWFYQSVVKLNDGVATTTANITSRKKAQAEILRLKDEMAQKATDKYQTLFNSIDEGFCVIEMLYDEEGNAIDWLYTEANPTFERQTGINPIGKKVSEVVGKADAFWLNFYETVATTGEPARTENLVTQTGRWYNVFASRMANESRPLVAVVFDDVTERKSCEQTQAFFFDIAQDLARLTNMEATLQNIGKKIATHFDVPWCQFSELTGDFETTVASYGWHAQGFPSLNGVHQLRDFLSDEQLQKHNAGEISVVADTQHNSHVNAEQYAALGIRSFIMVPLSHNGEWQFLLSIIDAKPRHWKKDEIEQVSELANQIWIRIEKARAEIALHQSEEKYRTLFESIDEGFNTMEMVFDDEGQAIDAIILEVNSAYEKMSGLRNVVGKHIREFMPTVDEEIIRRYGQVAITGQPIRYEQYINSLDSWYEIYAAKVDAADSHIVAVVFNNITERKRNEQRQEFLLKLSDALRPLADANAIKQTAMQLLGAHLNVHRAFYGDMLDNEDSLLIGPGYANILSPLEGSLSLAAFDTDMVDKHFRLGHTVVIDNVEDDAQFSKAALEQFAAIGVKAAAGVPLLKAGKLRGVLSIHQAVPRKWTASEIALLEETAERTWATVERAKAETQLANHNLLLEEQVKERTSELKENRDLLAVVYNNLPVSISLLKPIYTDDGRLSDFLIRLTNRELNKETGRTDLVGKHYATEYPGIKPTGIFDLAVQAALTGEPQELEYFYPHEGFKKWYYCRFIKTGDSVLATNENVTARKLSSASLLKQATILQHTEAVAAIGSWEYEIATGRFTWSDGMYRLFNIPIGTPVQPAVYMDTCIKEDCPIAERIIDAIEKKHVPFSEELRVAQRGDGARLVRIKASVVNDESGIPQKVIGVDLDITDIREAESKLKAQDLHTQTLIDASIDQITIFDREERFLVWNKKAEEAGGLKREEVIGKTIAQVFPDIAEEPEFLEAQQRALAGETVYIPAKRGLYSTAYHQWFYVPLKTEEGEVYAVMNIIHDITDKVQVEEQLKRKNQQLLERNEEIAHFNFVASHDLKEPLRKVGTFSNWLVEREGQNLSDTGKQMLNKLAGSVQRMELLVDDISTLTQLQKAPGDLEAVELNLVLRKALVVLQPTITSADAVVDGNNLPTIPGYKEQLETLFVNLISNGVKFQKEGMIPAVEISCKRRLNPIGLPRGEWYCLSFSDNGIGFDVQYSDKIFRVFQRLHGQSEYPGTGIGLAICRKVMENHNGFITAVSEPGKGARFDCWFPVV